MLHHDTAMRAVRELSGAEIKCLIATAYSNKPLTVEDYISVTTLNRSTVLLALERLTALEYICRTAIRRKFFHTITSTQSMLDFPTGKSDLRNVGKPDISGTSLDTRARTPGTTTTTSLKQKRYQVRGEVRENPTPENHHTETYEQIGKLATHSADVLHDRHSIGYHVQCWRHAIALDRRDKTSVYSNALFELLTELEDRLQVTGKQQGHAWTEASHALFTRLGEPLP
jgi:hypothetical protein